MAVVQLVVIFIIYYIILYYIILYYIILYYIILYYIICDNIIIYKILYNNILYIIYKDGGGSNGKLPLRTCPGCSVPEPYQSPDRTLVSAQTGPRAEYQ